MMTSSRTALGLTLLLTASLLSSCAQSDADKIADAQACLDKSTDSTALACMSKVEGLTSPSSDLIRCSAYFIDQGFSSPDRLSRVSRELKNKDGSSSGSSTITILTLMAFSAQKYDMNVNFDLSETAFNSCIRSLSSGMVYLSSMTRIATATLKALNGAYDPTAGTLPTAAEIEQILCDPAGPAPETSIIIGSAAQIAYDANCKGKEPGKDPICDQYAAAVNAGATPAEIGAALASNLCTP